MRILTLMISFLTGLKTKGIRNFKKSNIENVKSIGCENINRIIFLLIKKALNTN